VSDSSAAIENATHQWVEGWCTRNSQALISLWNRDDQEAIYRPAERVDPLIGCEAVSEYVQNVCETFSLVRHRIERPVYRRLSSDVGMAFYSLDWAFSDNRGPIGGSCRVTALWRLTDTDWRLFHYAEAPLAPLLELQEFYERIASEGLGAIPKREGPT